MFQNYTFQLCAIALVLLAIYQVVPVCSDFALDIIVADYSISIERRDDGACCTCACCLAGICACPLGCCSTCNDRQLQLVAYAHLGGCQTSGCDLWGMYQVSLVNNLQITIEGSGGLSECPANQPISVVMEIFDEGLDIVNDNHIATLQTMTPQLTPFGGFLSSPTIDMDALTFTLQYQLRCGPSKPSVVISSSTVNSVSISWDDGMNVDSYLVRWISGSTENTESLSGETGSYVITGLETGSSYMVTVTASNSVGSSESDPEIAVTVPGTPVITVQPALTSLLVCWTDTGPLVDRVLVELSGGTDRSFTVTDGSSSFSVTGLEEGTSYTVRVTAENSAGDSGTALQNAVTEERPEPSTVTVAEITITKTQIVTSSIPCPVRTPTIITTTVTLPPTTAPCPDPQSGGKDNSVAIGAGLAVGLTAVGVMAIVAIAVAVYYKRKKQRPLPPTPAGAEKRAGNTVVAEPFYERPLQRPPDTRRSLPSENVPRYSGRMSSNLSYETHKKVMSAVLASNQNGDNGSGKPTAAGNVDEEEDEYDYMN